MIQNKGKPSVMMIMAGIVIVLICIFPVLLLAAQEETIQKVGDETCAECHDDITEAFAMNAHMQSGHMDGFVCESCHGPGAIHAEEQDLASIYNPATDYNAAHENMCVTCHQGGQFESMTGTAHWEMAGGCSDCHQVHSTNRRMLKKPADVLCNDCHRDVLMQFNLPSRHPLNEGIVSCNSCHNVHGDHIAMTMSAVKSELCFTCHQEKEGPFVFEHAPVQEDCSICHAPHGSIANNLLVQNEPALCMNCHPMHFHTTITAVDGDFTAPLTPERGGTSTLDAWKSGMLTKCTQCHIQVHGSDLPSQGLSSFGKSLTR